VVGTPFGDFVRARRDALQPASVGLPEHGRRRAAGLRRSDLAVRAGISVEYLTRIEQGRDRNPSPSVVNALADGLDLDPAERAHLRYLAKLSAGECSARRRPAPVSREVRESVRQTLRLLEPGVAAAMNRLGDVLAYTGGFELVTAGSGLLEPAAPNLTRYVFTDPGARRFFADWADVADQQAFDLWFGPSKENSEWCTAQLAPIAGPEFTSRVYAHRVPRRGVLRINHPSGRALGFRREVLEIPADAQQIVVFLPADDATAHHLDELRRARTGGRLRAVS
jgi:transcriptional regulator with XRE-family HTH domain